MDSTRIRVNGLEVMHETIDEEVIIINLSSGNYYSARGVGADVWTLIAGAPDIGHPELVRALGARYAGQPTELEAAVGDFVSDLRAEGLVEDADDSGSSPAQAVDLQPFAGEDELRPFVAPKLEKFTDLQDLVLLDPVHQVDQAGWPAPAPDLAR